MAKQNEFLKTNPFFLVIRGNLAQVVDIHVIHPPYYILGKNNTSLIRS